MKLRFFVLKTSFFLFLFCCANEKAFAQSAVDSSQEETFTFAEVMPEYVGGLNEMYQYISKIIRYPDSAQKHGIQGRIIVKFVVDTQGNVKNVEAKTHVGYGLEQEGIRVIASMPKWKPGKNNGKAVNTYFTIPIKFTMPEEEENKK